MGYGQCTPVALPALIQGALQTPEEFPLSPSLPHRQNLAPNSYWLGTGWLRRDRVQPQAIKHSVRSPCIAYAPYMRSKAACAAREQANTLKQQCCSHNKRSHAISPLAPSTRGGGACVRRGGNWQFRGAFAPMRKRGAKRANLGERHCHPPAAGPTAIGQDRACPARRSTAR